MKSTAKALGLALLTSTLVATGCNSTDTEAPKAGTPTPDSTKLTISGLVTDDPIVNAGVSFMVGTTEFAGSSPTGSLGEFQIEIESQDPNALVVGSAFDAANSVRLNAVLDTFQGAMNKANNNVVNNIKITNITTAQKVLTERLALDGSVDSYAEFVDLLPQVDATELFELSASIKTVVENIDGVVLPADYVDTLELAKAIADGTSTFNADIELTHPGAFAAAQDKLLSDGHATLPFSAADAPGVYVAADNSYIYAIFDNGTALTEFFDDSAMTTTPSWSISGDGKIQINFYDFDRSADSVTLLSANSDSFHMVTEGLDANGDMTSRAAATVSKFSFDDGVDATTFAGTFSDSLFALNSLEFVAGGTGIATDAAGSQPFNWSVNGSGNLLVEFVNGGKSVEVINLAAGGDMSYALSIERSFGLFSRLSVGTW